ncbi:hypothetical protein EI427_11665 [Flammeovirga pectinis]|uniref:Uncharacterized protein n=1 Tax=Flammeovirga pectinis TaxID=2494373 RepID=A0A3S9P416_9BACT|nr:hypothetical protein [Flammeovirga pectinis]AZQ62868.1 hypothetical protein EI427_11665 [Flammeovirga pectinis]
MKKFKNTLFTFLLISLPLIGFSNNEKGGKDDDNDKKKSSKSSSYDHFNIAPKIKTAPFIKDLSSEHSLELFKDGKKRMLIDAETDNILYNNLKEGEDYLRVYTDNTDGLKCIIIWHIDKVDKETGDIEWKKYTYKKYNAIGWRPTHNDNTKVEAFK